MAVVLLTVASGWPGTGGVASARTAAMPPVGTITNLGLGVMGPHGIVPGPDGALWFANQNSSIGRITVDGELSNIPLGEAHPAGAPTVGPDGNLWFVVGEDSSSVGRMTLSGDLTTFPVPRAIHIVAGPDGNLWFTGMYDGIGRITPAGVVDVFTSPEITG